MVRARNHSLLLPVSKAGDVKFDVRLLLRIPGHLKELNRTLNSARRTSESLHFPKPSTPELKYPTAAN